MLLLGLAAGNVDPEVRPDLDTPLFGNRSPGVTWRVSGPG